MQGVLAWIHWALGPVVPLFLGTPWDVMRGWLQDAHSPVVHHRIGFRHVVLVGDAAGMKRIFQVRGKCQHVDVGLCLMWALGQGHGTCRQAAQGSPQAAIRSVVFSRAAKQMPVSNKHQS